MADSQKPNSQKPIPVLKKPPGYRDPAASMPAPGPKIHRPLPRRAQITPSFRPPIKPAVRRRRSCGRRICCWICLLLLLSLLILASFAALCYLYFQPRLPSFRLASLAAPRFRIAAGPDGGELLDVAVTFGFRAANPNRRMGVWYGEMDTRAAVADDDGDVEAGEGWVSGFEQRRGEAEVVRFETAAKGVPVDDAVGARLKGVFRKRAVRFRVEVGMRVGAVVWGRRTGGVPIRVVCGAVSLRRMGRKGAVGPQCQINLFRWINLD